MVITQTGGKILVDDRPCDHYWTVRLDGQIIGRVIEVDTELKTIVYAPTAPDGSVHCRLVVADEYPSTVQEYLEAPVYKGPELTMDDLRDDVHRILAYVHVRVHGDLTVEPGHSIAQFELGS